MGTPRFPLKPSLRVGRGTLGIPDYYAPLAAYDQAPEVGPDVPRAVYTDRDVYQGLWTLDDLAALVGRLGIPLRAGVDGQEHPFAMVVSTLLKTGRVVSRHPLWDALEVQYHVTPYDPHIADGTLRFLTFDTSRVFDPSPPRFRILEVSLDLETFEMEMRVLADCGL